MTLAFLRPFFVWSFSYFVFVLVLVRDHLELPFSDGLDRETDGLEVRVVQISSAKKKKIHESRKGKGEKRRKGKPSIEEESRAVHVVVDPLVVEEGELKTER